MRNPFPRSARAGAFYHLGVAAVWPPMMAFTRRDWHGQENLGKPGDGIVVVANHMSWFDPLVLLHYVNDAGRPGRFLAKDAIFDIPAIGRVVKGAGTIPVHRGTADAAYAVEAAVEAVRNGEVVVVYIEGTLTRDPDLWPMSGKSGAARIALASGAPMVPVAHWGVQEIMRPYEKKLHLFPPKTIHVKAGAPIDLDDLRGLPITTPVLAETTVRALDALAQIQSEFRGEPPPDTRWDMKAGERRPIVRGLAAQEQMLVGNRAADESGSGPEPVAGALPLIQDPGENGKIEQGDI